MTTFDPNAASPKDSGIFGLPYTPTESKLVLIPVPWEATTSYGGGTSLGPQAILQASRQVDLFDIDLGNFFRAGISMLDEASDLIKWNQIAKQAAQIVITADDATPAHEIANAKVTVNQYSEQVNQFVYEQTKYWLAQDKIVGVVGGDHSVPLGTIRAYLEKYPNMGILHIDAHADLRCAFEGFAYSHASIMYNVMQETSLAKLVQVGIRDFCEEEFDFINAHPARMKTFFDAELAEQKLQGKNWAVLCDEMISHLPQEVYISFDIDGLDSRFCPHTGTPVPGGLEYTEVLYLIKKVALSGRKIIGFDLNEVSLGHTLPETIEPSAEWDANVGARILYKLCGWTLKR